MSELISSDHKTNLIGTYWKVLVAFRWTLTLLILVFGRDHFEMQIMTLLSLSVLFQALMIGSSPMLERGNQKMSLFNEVATSLYLYVLMLLSEFMGETGIRDYVGQALLVVVGGVVGINFFRVLFNIPGQLKSHYITLKKKCSKNDASKVVKMKP